MRIDPAQLEAMLAVADHGSMSAAARALHLTQPALSRRIAALEATMGLKLFHRTDRATCLTNEGASLTPYARRVLGDCADVATVVEALHGLSYGTLHVAGLPSLVTAAMPAIATEYHHRYPNIALRLSGAADADSVAAMVAHAECDIGLTDLEEDYPGLVSVPLGAFGMLAVFCAEDDARTGSPVADLTRADLENCTLVTLPTGTLTRTLTDQVYADVGLVPERVVTTTQRDALVPLAISGLGVTFVPEPLARAAAPAARLARPSSLRSRRFGLLHRPEIAAPAAAAFLAVARQAVVSVQ